MQTVDVAQKKKPRTDAVTASLKNVREQKELERQIEEIDRMWHIELKNITREKLELTYSLTKLEEDKKSLEYLNNGLHGESLKEYSEKARTKALVNREGDRTSHKYDFRNNEENKWHIHLPDVEKPLSILKQNGLQQLMPPLIKPKLYRSNSIVLQRTSSEQNVSTPNDTNITRTESKENLKFNFSLPDITNLDKCKNQFGRKMDKMRKTTLTAIPDENIPLESPRSKQRQKIQKLPPLSGNITTRCHTVL